MELLKQRCIVQNFLLVIVVSLAITYLFFNAEGSQKTFNINLKEGVAEIVVVGDSIKMEDVLNQALSKEKNATIGVLNGHGFYSKDDINLITVLEHEPASNVLIKELRFNAANLQSIFSNELRPVTVKIAPRFINSNELIAACDKSEYFHKTILLSSNEEDIFHIVKVNKSGACSEKNINQLYVNDEIGNYLLGCIGERVRTFKAKVQLYDGPGILVRDKLCG